MTNTTKRPTIDELLDELENLVQCTYYDRITESAESEEALDFVFHKFRELYPDRFAGAVARAKAEIIEQGDGDLLDSYPGFTELTNKEDTYD